MLSGLSSPVGAIAWFAVGKDKHKKAGEIITGLQNKPTDY
jgi:hypothetical protein